MASIWDEIRAYLDGREDEADEDEERAEADEDEADEEAQDEDDADEGGESAPDQPTPYRDALRAAGDAAPESIKALALGNPALTVARWLDNLHQRAERPGSVLPLVFVLLFLIFAMVPVNGSATRFELLWRALTGGAALPPSATELALAAQYQDLAAARQTETAINSAVWSGMWDVAGTFNPALPIIGQLGVP